MKIIAEKDDLQLLFNLLENELYLKWLSPEKSDLFKQVLAIGEKYELRSICDIEKEKKIIQGVKN